MTIAQKSEVYLFITRIKTFLKQADLTSAELAASIGVKRNTLSCWLSKSRAPSQESIMDFNVRMKAFQHSVNAACAALDNFFVGV